MARPPEAAALAVGLTGALALAALAVPLLIADLLAASDRPVAAATWAEPATHDEDAASEQLVAGDRAIARRLLRAALARSPENARGWARLAAAELPDDPVAARAAWLESVRVARFDPDLVAARVALGFRLPPSSEVTGALTGQIRAAAEVAPLDLAGAVRTPGQDRLVRAALIDSAALTARYRTARAS